MVIIKNDLEVFEGVVFFFFKFFKNNIIFFVLFVHSAVLFFAYERIRTKAEKVSTSDSQIIKRISGKCFLSDKTNLKN